MGWSHGHPASISTKGIMNEPELTKAIAFISLEANAVEAVTRQLDESFLALADAIEPLPGKVITAGAGTSATIARRLAHLLTVTGTPAFFQDPLDALHGSLAVGKPGDLLLAISKGGETDELTELVQRMSERGVATAAIVGRAGSALAEAVGTAAVVESRTANPGGILAMGSTLAHAAFGDALALTLMERRGYTWEQVLQAHPGGLVGKQAAQSQPETDGDPS